MKKFILIFALFVVAPQIQAQSKKADFFTVQVDGLGCPFCAYGLEKKFKELKGVKKLKIDMETGILNFTYPSAKRLSIEDVKQQVDIAGYTPVTVDILRADGTKETSTETSIKEEKTYTEAVATWTKLTVSGVCEMCKARIENAATNLDGVYEADWDKQTQILKLKLAPNSSLSKIAKAIATKGHDTEMVKATDEAYDKLAACCQYKRE